MIELLKIYAYRKDDGVLRIMEIDKVSAYCSIVSYLRLYLPPLSCIVNKSTIRQAMFDVETLDRTLLAGVKLYGI